MKSVTSPALCPSNRLQGAGRVGTGNSGIDLCDYATKLMEAAQLIRLGARAGLALRLTGLEKKLVKRLYRQIIGHPSPPGQVPFTDTWYRDDDRRMLEAALVWHLHRRLQRTECSPARLLIDVFETYRHLVPAPLLDITRAFFVLELVTTKTWAKCRCEFCGMTYVDPVPRTSSACPGCRLYFRHRCHQCGSRLVPKSKGRRRSTCSHCGSKLDIGVQK